MNILGLLIQLLCSTFEYAYPIERDAGAAANGETMFKLSTKFSFSPYSPNVPSKNTRPQSAATISTSEPVTTIIPDIDLSSELINKNSKVSLVLKLTAGHIFNWYADYLNLIYLFW